MIEQIATRNAEVTLFAMLCTFRESLNISKLRYIIYERYSKAIFGELLIYEKIVST